MSPIKSSHSFRVKKICFWCLKVKKSLRPLHNPTIITEYFYQDFEGLKEILPAVFCSACDNKFRKFIETKNAKIKNELLVSGNVKFYDDLMWDSKCNTLLSFRTLF